MAFTAKILSWRFRLLKRRPTKGGSRAPQDPPLATPLGYGFRGNYGSATLNVFIVSIPNE